MSRARILVVDDEASTRDLMSRILTEAEYEVVDTFNAEEAVALLHRESFDLVTLDVMMPHVDGFECCRRIRQFSNVPIVFVTARGESYNEVLGLESGADDYIQKPYHPEAVVSRVKALLRRVAQRGAPESAGTRIGPLTLDMRGQDAFIKGQSLGLTSKEFELLHILSENIGTIVPRERLASLGYANVMVECGDGYNGWPEYAPFDIILVTAAPNRVPDPLIEQLAVGGRLVIPVGRVFQELLLIEKKPDGSLRRESVAPVLFVPMIGEVDRDQR